MAAAEKSVSPVREPDEFQGVYRCAPFFFRPLQRKHQLLGARSTAARQNHPADGKGDPDDHPDRSEVYETEGSSRRRTADALALQRPLPDDALWIDARGEKEDGAAVGSQ
jgi:hypothetical protein